jgi:phosphate transport system permease protein
VLFLAAFVLFVFTFLFNTLAEFVRQRLREKYSSL